MKHLITAVAMAASVALAPVQAQTVDQILDQVKNGSLQKSKAAEDLEARFRSAGAGKAAIVANLRAQRETLDARSNQLEAQYAANNEELDQIRTARETALGDLKELFGAVQQVVGETEARFDTSIISSQFPDRGANFDEISKKVSMHL